MKPSLSCRRWLPCFTSRSEGKHILSGALAVLLVASSVALELLDFPPVYWIIDSHALWHIATVPLPLLWWVPRAGFSAGAALPIPSSPIFQTLLMHSGLKENPDGVGPVDNRPFAN